MMFVTLLSVVFGLSTIAPGIGIPLGVLLLVAWGRTVSVSRRREALGNPLTWSQHIQTYLSSFGFVVALLLMVTVGVCVAAGSVCFGIFSAAGAIGGSPTYQIGSILVCVVGLFAAIGTIRLAAKWNDYQWRRTTVQGQDMSNGREKR